METFTLTQSQFNEWDNFCTLNYETLYENGNGYMNEYNEQTKKFIVHVPVPEQSGIINFLKKLLDKK
jgi:hypothetical protein